MEQKTIGKFITALRKANGMTQKELAEQLNVSDKTISRWERDDGSPDLSVIPVIAEIFGVTCDELLRGERKSAAERTSEHVDETTPRGEKQRQRILKLSLSKYCSRSFVSIGISVVGLIAAMICNLGFNRGYIGFFVGTIFYVASVVCQAIFINSALLSVSDDSISSEETSNFRATVIGVAKHSFTVTAILLGATLPILLFPSDTYMGLEGVSWLLSGLIFGGLAWLSCSIVWFFLQAHLLKKEICILEEEKERIYWKNHKLKRTCAISLAVLYAVTLIAQFCVNEVVGPWGLAHRTEFHDYESFVEFMEQDISYGYNEGSSNESWAVAEPLEAPTYYDENGNEITEEEALREEVRIPDGSQEGKVVCTFIHRNHAVMSWGPSDSADGLPMMVVTQQDYQAAQSMLDMINIRFLVLYAAETVVILLIYRKKRAQ